MLKGKKYYDENGIQLAVYFNEVMNLTQDVDGSYSHKGTKNLDDGGKDTGIDQAFAPFDGNYGWKHAPSTGDPTGIVFDSKEKVHTARLGIKYVIPFFWHDNDIRDVTKNAFVSQGDHFYDEGTAGHATGNHIHFGVTVSDKPYDGSYPLVQNSDGNWEIKNEVNAWDVFFVNDTVIKNGRGHSWLVYDKVQGTPDVVKESVTKPEVVSDEYYYVIKGDTLSKIAKAHGLTTTKLYDLNKDVIGPNKNLIEIGMKLRLSNSVEQADIKPTEVEVKVGKTIYWSGYLYRDSWGSGKTSKSYSKTKGVIDIINQNKFGIHIKGKGWVAKSQVTD